MKRRSIFAMAAFAATLAFSCAEAPAAQSTEVVVSEGLRFTESVCPYDGGMLIANFGGEALNGRNTDGLGYISMYKDGEVSVFIPNDGSLSAPKGMLVKDGYLLICDVNRLVSYNLNDLAAGSQTLRFPESEVSPNDITVDGDTIYVSISSSGNIFKLDGSDLTDITTLEPELYINVVGSNGILMHNSTLYVCSYGSGDPGEANVVYKISDLENPAPEKLFDIPSKWDGVAISEDGKTLYAGCWIPPRVIAVDLATGAVSDVEFETEIAAPADFAIFDGKLYVPDLIDSKLVIKEL